MNQQQRKMRKEAGREEGKREGRREGERECDQAIKNVEILLSKENQAERGQRRKTRMFSVTQETKGHTQQP